MNGGTISSMKFYLSSTSYSSVSATWEVYLAEVYGTELSLVNGPDEGTVVYTGALDFTTSTMSITFDTPFTYHGGNLLVGTYVSEASNYASSYFYGVTTTGNTARYKYQGWSGSWYEYAVSFLPKTTFNYTSGGVDPGDEPGDDPVVDDGTAPTNVCAEAMVVNGDSLVHIWWNFNPPTGRELQHFRVYRTNCYNDGPYNSENTDLLVSAWMPDFSYYDVSWPYAEPGVYKFGVSAVYSDGRDEIVDYPALEGESEIVWSDLCGPCIDKDMETQVTVNVVLNSADSPEGTIVAFTNLNEVEQQNYPIYPITLDGTGFYAFDTFRKGEYLVTVYLPGYYPIQEEVSIWEPTDLRYVLIEIIYGVKNLYVSRTGWAMWEPITPADDTINNPFGPDGPGGPGGELTVYDGSATSSYVPVYGLFADDYFKSEMIMPAADLAELPHTNINSLKWEIASTASYSDAWNGPFKIFMKEVDATTISAYQGMDGATLVYEGPIDAHTDTEIEINFTTPYHYNGGNLLIGVYKESYQSMVGWGSGSFKGEQRSGASIYGYSYSSLNAVSATQGNFLPKTTFYYGNGAKNRDDRHLESFKVMCTSIDDVPIWNHNTPFDQPFCQLTTVDMWSGNDMLVEGEYYKVKVCAYYSTGQSVWCEPVIWQYEPCDHWGPVDAVEASTIAEGNHIEWVFEHGHNQWIDFPGGDEPGGDEPGGDEPGDVIFSESWDEGLNGWTNIDADGDGHVWYHDSEALDNHDIQAGTTHSGAGCLFGESYCNGLGYYGEELYPDDYLVSPQKFAIANGSTVSVWASARDNQYAAEHFGVFVSTASNTNPSDFTEVQSWTLTSKGGQGAKTSGPRGTRTQGSWHQYTCDLSAYAGQEVWIAIRHFDCSDEFIIMLDDFELTGGTEGAKLAKGSEVYWQFADNGIMLNFYAIDNYHFRFYLLYLLSNNDNFALVHAEEYGKFIVSVKDENRGLMDEFETLYANAIADFNLMSKIDVANNMGIWKSSCNPSDVTSISMDVIVNGTRLDNDLCINSFPFCAVDGYAFDASFGAASAQEDADYGCMISQPNPAWYHMRIRTAGQFVIHMESHATTGSYSTYDIDFCLWGPFDDPYEPCLSDLTTDKIIDCSWSVYGTEDCYLGYPVSEHQHQGSSYMVDGDINYHVPEVGEYYILLISNYSNQPCNISFVKTEGVGDTDCDIVNPTVDIIGFLVTIDGEYLAIVGPDEREYTHEGEFGEHEYCVRPIYPGPAQLPDTNYYFSMGCPVCMGTTGEIDDSCDPGDPIYAEVDNTEDQVHIWWGNVPGPVGEPFFDDFDEGSLNNWTLVDSDGDGDLWQIATPIDYGIGNPHSGVYCASSWSWNNYSIDPDNWMISPEVLGASSIHYYVATNTGYPDHYAIMASSTGTNLSDFTMVFEEDAPIAKGMSLGTKSSRTEGNRDLSPWTERTINLPAGTKYVAFRHYNSYDMNYLFIDDVTINVSRNNRAEIVSYNIYRSTDNVNYELIANIPADGGNYYEYFDNPGAGTFYYQVTAVYSDGCESDPTTSGAEPTHNYVVVGVTGVDELADTVNLFPNPTKNNITVQAPGMKRIAVVSVLGQVVFDTELNASEYVINMGQFNPGMYMVRVYTENGMTVKRVTVMQ